MSDESPGHLRGRSLLTEMDAEPTTVPPRRSTEPPRHSVESAETEPTRFYPVKQALPMFKPRISDRTLREYLKKAKYDQSKTGESSNGGTLSVAYLKEIAANQKDTVFSESGFAEDAVEETRHATAPPRNATETAVVPLGESALSAVESATVDATEAVRHAVELAVEGYRIALAEKDERIAEQAETITRLNQKSDRDDEQLRLRAREIDRITAQRDENEQRARDAEKREAEAKAKLGKVASRRWWQFWGKEKP